MRRDTAHRIPVVYITAPPKGSPRKLAMEFARFLGLPVTSRANTSTACVTGNAPWKWHDVIADLGMRQADIAHQDFVTVARTLDDILDAHHAGRLALVLGLEAATPIENELDRLDILYGLGVR